MNEHAHVRDETLVVDEPSATSSFEFDFESETLTEKNVRDLVFTELCEFDEDLRAAEVSAGGRQSSFPHLSSFPFTPKQSLDCSSVSPPPHIISVWPFTPRVYIDRYLGQAASQVERMNGHMDQLTDR